MESTLRLIRFKLSLIIKKKPAFNAGFFLTILYQGVSLL
jgi:hypothetical protein